MRYRIQRGQKLALLGVCFLSVTNVGCSAGSWKMPSMNMFSWSKKPSPTTVAGSGPSALTYPESPANKHTPTSVASTAAGAKPTTSVASNTARPPIGPDTQFVPASSVAGQNGFNSSAPSGPANGYSLPGQTAFSGQPGSTGSPYISPSPTAAVANGYATGPYSTTGQPNAASALANSGVPARPASAPVNPMANPIGNPMMPAGTSPQFNTAQFNGGSPNTIPTSSGFAGVSGNVPTNPSANGFPAQQSYQGVGGNGFQVPAGLGAPTGLPPMNGGAVATSSPNGAAPINNNLYNPIGTTATTQSPSGSAFPSASSPWGAPPSATAQTASFNGASGGGFRPGSTGRETGYNFSQPQSSGSQSVPNTASGFSDPGFQLPPSGTLQR